MAPMQFFLNRRRNHADSPATITLDVTPDMLRTLQDMSAESGRPLPDLMTRAISLYGAALRAIAEGKHVGYSQTPDGLEVEFTGIGASEASPV